MGHLKKVGELTILLGIGVCLYFFGYKKITKRRVIPVAYSTECRTQSSKLPGKALEDQQRNHFLSSIQGERTKYRLYLSPGNVVLGEITMQITDRNHQNSMGTVTNDNDPFGKAYSFEALASTDQEVSSLIVAEEVVRSHIGSHGWHSVKYYHSQDERMPNLNPVQQETFIDFDYQDCSARLKQEAADGDVIKDQDYYLKLGASDPLTALYKMRFLALNDNLPQDLYVYVTNENWKLSMIPLTSETIEIDAGVYEATKYRLRSFRLDGVENDKGEIYLWFDRNHPQRHLLKVKGSVNLASIRMEMTK